MYNKFFKRFLDILLACVGLTVLSPLFLILAVAVKIDSKGPALFKQKRVGKDKELFQIHKFRSMKITAPKDTPTHQLANPAAYISKFQALLRKSSMDELPQLWDILTGKMSWVGPRPALWTQQDLIDERDKYGANGVRPGLTGWAQINGRDELEIARKARLDGEYVEKMGFLFDCKCFFGTVTAVLSRKGVAEGGPGPHNAHNEKKAEEETEAGGI
jgi:O-antigen biosynthesis protein WbqP